MEETRGTCPLIKTLWAALPFSYIALGHIHKPAVLLENRMAYPGSPEPLDLTETGPHGYLTGEIDDATGHVTSLSSRLPPRPSISHW